MLRETVTETPPRYRYMRTDFLLLRLAARSTILNRSLVTRVSLSYSVACWSSRRIASYLPYHSQLVADTRHPRLLQAALSSHLKGRRPVPPTTPGILWHHVNIPTLYRLSVGARLGRGQCEYVCGLCAGGGKVSGCRVWYVPLTGLSQLQEL